MPFSFRNIKYRMQKLRPAVMISMLVIATFLFTGMLMTFTGSALSALILVLVILVSASPLLALMSDDTQKF